MLCVNKKLEQINHWHTLKFILFFSICTKRTQDIMNFLHLINFHQRVLHTKKLYKNHLEENIKRKMCTSQWIHSDRTSFGPERGVTKAMMTQLINDFKINIFKFTSTPCTPIFYVYLQYCCRKKATLMQKLVKAQSWDSTWQKCHCLLQICSVVC